jgi:hypothetical protein
MEAGLADHMWDVEELVALLPEPKPTKRGPFKKRTAAWNGHSERERKSRFGLLAPAEQL